MWLRMRSARSTETHKKQLLNDQKLVRPGSPLTRPPRNKDETKPATRSLLQKPLNGTLPRKIQLSQPMTSRPSLLQLQKTSTPYGPLEYLPRTPKQDHIVLSVRPENSYKSVHSHISHLSIHSSLSIPFHPQNQLLYSLTHPFPTTYNPPSPHPHLLLLHHMPLCNPKHHSTHQP